MSDQHARIQALDPTFSFIVKAPAGSGKTELLTQRFLRLLSFVQKAPEEILAVTFTRKAASQMRQRILQALNTARIQPEPEKAHEKMTWDLARAVLKKDEALGWHLQQNPNRLRIMTIDAMCAQIVSRMPILSHFGTMPQISDYPQRYYEQAIKMMFKETTFEEQWAKSLQKLLLHLDNRIEMIFDLLVMMLAKRDQWLPHLGALRQQATGLAAHLNRCFKDIIEEHLAQLREKFSSFDIRQLMRSLQFARTELDKKLSEHLLVSFTDFNDLPSPSIDALPLWEAIAEFLTTKQNTWRKAFNQSNGFPSPAESKNKEEKAKRKLEKEAVSELIETFARDPVLLILLNDVKLLPPTKLSDSQHEILSALSELLPVLVAFLQVVFRQVGQVDFIEVNLRALDALGDELAPSDIALSLDYQLQHLLIDEYQDTSVTQYRLFEKLVMGWQPGDGRTLFLVGDPMQSIYRFRGAEVSLFLYTQEHGLAHVKLVPLALSVNFRSADKLINWINVSFLHIFPQNEDKTYGAVRYANAIAQQSSKRDQVIEFHPLMEENANQANAVVNIVLKTLAEHPNDNIAILVRAKRHLAVIISQLKQLHIPFVAHEVEHLAHRSHMTDLISLLRATTDWTDLIAWYAILRAPWIGLSLADLLVISKNNCTDLLWETLQNYQQFADLSSEGKARLDRTLPCLRYFIENRQRNKLSPWLRGLWMSLGGPACYAQPYVMNDIDQALSLIDDYVSAGKIDTLSVLEAKLSELYGDVSPVALSQQANGPTGMVELMTIHKAKGLEFDTVILPHLEEKNVNQDHGLLLWLERATHSGVDLILAPKRAHSEESDPLYRYVLKQQQKKANYEAARLLYVGVTRAKKTLHLVADCQVQEDKPFKPAAASFLEMLWPAFEQSLSVNQAQKESASEVKEINKNADKLHQNTLQRLPLNWRLPEEIAMKLDENRQKAQETDLNLPEKGDFIARATGKVFHRILQSMVNSGLAFEKLPETIPTACEFALRRYGLLAKPLESAKAMVLKALHNMLADEKGQWILSPNHTDQHAEWRLSVRTGQGIENNVIDYAFVDHTNTRWIIDYKLTHVEHMTPVILQEEIERYRPQLIKYQRMLAQKEQRVVRSGLYFPLAKVWWEHV